MIHASSRILAVVLVAFSLAAISSAQTAPTISTLAPTSGAVGTSVTITGTNFGSSQGSSTVTFNGTTSTPSTWSSSSITAPVPTGATTGDVVVTVGGLASNGVAFTIAPSISSISPNAGAAGTAITISGLNFGATQGSSTVTFNGTSATPTTWNSTTIVVPVPAGATTGQVVVTVGGLSSNGVSFTGAPILTGISPASAAVGANLTLSGFDFGATQGSSSVTFNGAAGTPTTWGTQTVIVPVPASATNGPIVVTVAGMASNSLGFSLAPGITSLSPISGAPGTVVTISGSGFGASQGGSTVTFNGVLAAPSTWNNSTITVPAPSGPTTGLVLVTAGGVSSNGIAFSSGPQISSVVPSSGPTGTTVTINGLNFGATQGQSTVMFDGVAASPTNWGPSRIVVPVPTGATTGPVQVTVAGQYSNGLTFTVGTGTVSGTVTRASDGTPVSSALVEALQANLAVGSATTAANGTYTISNLNPGSYDVRTTATGYGTSISTGNNVSAETTTTINLSLGSSGTVSGHVTQSDGVTSLPGATVTVFQGNSAAGTAATDSSGNYSVSTLAAGTYTVQAAASGYKAQSQPGVSVTAGGNTTANFALSGQSVITYDYDGVGRLVGAVDSQSDAVAYNYDAVGNLVGISRNHSNQASILYFEPQSGATTTTVTISGTGFSTTPSQNTVQFNGTNATVTSSTSTQIVTTVPASATTGLITVVAPAGTATSSSPFTVTAANGAPSISSFTPTVGTPGTATTISGTNFDLAANDRTKFNLQLATVSSATSTSISTVVPALATSGHISVATPSGTAVSPGDFFVPPSPYTANNVSLTGRMTIGGVFTGTIATAGQIGLIVFDGTAGQKVSLLATGSVAGDNLQINNPNGSTLTWIYTNSSPGFLDAAILPVSGTYTIFISGSAIGSLTLNLYDATDIQAPITPGGSSIVVTTSPGQNEYLTFSASVAQQIGINLTNGSYSSCNLTLYAPNGSAFTTGSCSGATNTISQFTVNAGGTYKLLLDPQGAATGSVTVQVTSVLPVTGTITPGGPPVTVTTTQSGQDAALTFAGATGQRVSLAVTNVTNPSASVSLVKPDGTSPGGVAISTSCNPCFMDTQTLTAPGTYTLWVHHNYTYVGSETLQLYNVPADATGTITVGGSTVPVATTVPGQNASLTFSGASGQKVSMSLTSGSYSSCNLTLYDPSGASVKTGGCSGTTGFIDSAALTTTGTYRIFIDPQYAVTGGVTVRLNNDSDVMGTITPGGPPVTVTTTVAGQDARLTFSGTAGQRVSLTVTSVTNPTAYVYLVKPDGTNQTDIPISTGCSCFMDTQTLATTGTYTLWVQHYSTYVGSETLQLYNVPADATGTITVGGSTVPVATTVPGQNASLTFSGASGQKVSMSLTSGSYSSCNLTLYDPSGASVKTGGCNGATGFIDSAALATTGTYKIFIDPQYAATGGVTVQLNNTSDVTGTITPGGSAVAVTTTAPGQDARLTFSATAGQRVSLTVTSVTNPTAYVYLVKPDGTNQTSIVISTGCNPCFMDTQSLATTGTYTLWVLHYYTYVGSETLQLYNVTDATGTVTVGGAATPVTVGTPGQNAQVTFSGTASQQVTVHITNNTIGTMTVKLLNPPGGTLTTSTSGSASFDLATQTLSTTGTYTISVDPSGASTGSVSVSVSSP